MQTKKSTTDSRRAQAIAKLYTPSKPTFNTAGKISRERTTHAPSIDYTKHIRQELVKSLGLTFLFIVLQWVLYFSYFKHI